MNTSKTRSGNSSKFLINNLHSSRFCARFSFAVVSGFLGSLPDSVITQVDNVAIYHKESAGDDLGKQRSFS